MSGLLGTPTSANHRNQANQAHVAVVAVMADHRALMLIRLKTHQPDGTRIAESHRVCHLVPVPGSPELPEFLTAYCGLRIAPGAGEVIPSAIGMPCEPCMANSDIPAFAGLRAFRSHIGDGDV